MTIIHDPYDHRAMAYGHPEPPEPRLIRGRIFAEIPFEHETSADRDMITDELVEAYGLQDADTITWEEEE